MDLDFLVVTDAGSYVASSILIGRCAGGTCADVGSVTDSCVPWSAFDPYNIWKSWSTTTTFTQGTDVTSSYVFPSLFPTGPPFPDFYYYAIESNPVTAAGGNKGRKVPVAICSPLSSTALLRGYILPRSAIDVPLLLSDAVTLLGAYGTSSQALFWGLETEWDWTSYNLVGSKIFPTAFPSAMTTSTALYLSVGEYNTRGGGCPGQSYAPVPSMHTIDIPFALSTAS